MNDLHVVSSGSGGNCYLLCIDEETLIIDCGIPIKKIKAALNWDIKHVVGAICCHAHQDHALSINELQLLGLSVFAPYISDHGTVRKRMGGFDVTGFPLRSTDGKWLHTNNDGSECPIYGFLIRKGTFSMLYMSDFRYCPFTFKRQKLTAMLIECNHVSDLLSDEEAKYSHSVFGHASLDVTKGIVAANKTESLKVVILCHLSNGWSDEGRMAAEVKEVAGNVNVHIANAGESYQLFPYI